jgi:transposase InsO family protein
MADTLDRQLALDSLLMALLTRKPNPSLIHHSERGSQYASNDDQAL